MQKIIAGISILALLAFTVPILADDTAAVSATVTPQLISVAVSPPSIDYGIVPLGTTSVPSAIITATNNGNVIEDFDIVGADSTNWTLSDTSTGANQFMHLFATDDDSYTTYTALAKDPTYKTLATSTPVSGTQLFKLKIDMPTISATTTQQTTIVTVRASL